MTFKEFATKIWNWHGLIGKVLTIFCVGAFVAAVLGIATGATKCHYENEIVYTNTFLNEQAELHDSNYTVTVLSARSVSEIQTKNKKGAIEKHNGHYIEIELTIFQKDASTLKKHSFDRNDFKIKNHTGVYLPLNDVASLVGWDMIDYHWDQAKNGFVISSADFRTEKAFKDYSLLNESIVPGETKELKIYFPMNEKYDVESQIMVLEIDFKYGGFFNSAKRGEDIILLPRPENIAKDNSINQV